MIIFNEEQYAQELLKHHKFTRKKWYEIQLIAIYYYNEGYNDEQIYKLIDNICKKNFNNYISTKTHYVDIIQNIIKKAHTKTLKVPQKVFITQLEIDTILSESNYKFQKFLFVYLVLAKYYMSLNNTQEYYVGCKDKDLFDLCKMYITKADRESFVHQATSKGYITPTLNLSSIVNYVDKTGDAVIELTPDDNMVYYFEQYLNKGNFFNCEVCGNLTKRMSNSQKYCKMCALKLKNES